MTYYANQRKNIKSHCCGSTIQQDTDICDDCKDHCQGDQFCNTCDGEGWVEIIDQSKVHSATIDIPYKKVPCDECKGEGFIVIDIEL